MNQKSKKVVPLDYSSVDPGYLLPLLRVIQLQNPDQYNAIVQSIAIGVIQFKTMLYSTRPLRINRAENELMQAILDLINQINKGGHDYGKEYLR